MKIDFTKIHGIGNDFIIIDPAEFLTDYSEGAKKICHRRFGVGADGFMVAEKSSRGDIRMVYFNGDGSPANMCGNGLRAFAKYAFDNKRVPGRKFTVETSDGIKPVEVTKVDGRGMAARIQVEIGWYRLDFLKKEIPLPSETVNLGSLTLGVPHGVIFEEKLSSKRVKTLGPILEKHPMFPLGTNVNFAEILSSHQVKVETWERGCGHTLACGTGMTSVAVLGNLLGRLASTVTVHSPGGSLEIEIIKDRGQIRMIGPAETICRGSYEFKFSKQEV